MDILNLNLDEANEVLAIRLQYILDQLSSNYKNALSAAQQIVRLKGIQSPELDAHIARLDVSLASRPPHAVDPDAGSKLIGDVLVDRDSLAKASDVDHPLDPESADEDENPEQDYDDADERLLERVRLVHLGQEKASPDEKESVVESAPSSTSSAKSTSQTSSTSQASSTSQTSSTQRAKSMTELLEQAFQEAEPVTVKPRTHSTECAKLNRLHAMSERQRRELYAKIFMRAQTSIEASAKVNPTIRNMSQEERDQLIEQTASAYLDEFVGKK